MNEKPILFNTEMVRAILEGRKTVTRRAIKPRYKADECGFQIITVKETGEFVRVEKIDEYENSIFADGTERYVNPPYYQGDSLYVREAFYKDARRYMYRADYSENEKFYVGGKEIKIRWSPSIHMPREAARIFLRVTDVHVEQLQDIDYEGCKAEGIWDDYKTYSQKYHDALARRAYPVVFSKIWDETIRPANRALYGWDANPWVWVISFERLQAGDC